MDMNYYEILAVLPTASADDIKKAYKQTALKNHPDRGGEHAKMVLVNEAYMVLSDPVLRAQYDHFLAAGTTNESTWQAQAAPAQEAAQQYPRSWPEFDRWSERLAADFARARYSKTEIWNGVYLPQIDNSNSGCLFCLLGAVMGIGFLGFYWGLYPWLWHNFQLPKEAQPKPFMHPFMKMFLVALPPFLGSWGGYYLHQFMGLIMTGNSRKISAEPLKQRATQSQPPPPPPPIESQILTCPQCQQKLRLPTQQGTLSVTCPKCRHQFSWQS